MKIKPQNLPGFKGKRDMLYAVVADTAFKKPADELVKLLSEADQLATLRNDLVHGYWHWRVKINGDTKTEAVVAIFKPRSQTRHYMFDVGVDDLTAWTADVAALTMRLQELDPKALTRRREHRKKNPRN